MIQRIFIVGDKLEENNGSEVFIPETVSEIHQHALDECGNVVIRSI